MVKQKIFDNGLTLIVEEETKKSSFALGFTIKSGSGQENNKNNGIHHFIEHMLFKGTTNYSWQEIASLSDRFGGHLNAYTSKEITQVYLKAITEKFDQCFDLLFDMIFYSVFKDTEFQRERDVILQEISEDKDNPQIYTFDVFFKNAIHGNGMNLPILGTKDSVSSFTKKDVYDYYKKQYVPENIVISIAGGISFQKVCNTIIQKLSKYPSATTKSIVVEKCVMNQGMYIEKNSSLEQIYSIIGLETVSADSKQKYLSLVLNEILGSGMSSRLFQKIREEKGLAYSIGSNIDRNKSGGFLLISSIIIQEKIFEYLSAVREVFDGFTTGGIKEEELERTKDSLKASVILGMENNLSRMRFNQNSALYKHTYPIQKVISLINGLCVEDINCEIKKTIKPESAFITLYGNLKKEEFNEFIF